MKPAPKFYVLALLVAQLFARALRGEEPASCIHIRHEGKSYSLSYYGMPCPHRETPLLPAGLYRAAADWAFGAAGAKLISPWDAFRIFAREATLNETEKHGFSFGPDSFGPWSENEWAQDADQAYLCVWELFDAAALPESLKAFERDALAHRLAEESESLLLYRIRFRYSKKLTGKKRLLLVKLFVELEDKLRGESKLKGPTLSLEEVVRQRADPIMQAKRRETFGAFELEPMKPGPEK